MLSERVNNFSSNVFIFWVFLISFFSAGDFYTSFGANVTKQFTIASEHCQPTISFGNDCSALESPFINKCDYDGAGAAFGVLLGSNLRPRGKTNPNNLLRISQSKYFPSGSSVTGMSDTAYVYVPSACASGTTCRLHISFHGCQQYTDSIGKVYMLNTGYSAWAESNNVIVLFPQATTDFLKNPEGCFDWWGYGSSDYAVSERPTSKVYYLFIYLSLSLV